MGFAPNSVFYKSLTSIWLQNKELTPIEIKTPKLASKSKNGNPK